MLTVNSAKSQSIYPKYATEYHSNSPSIMQNDTNARLAAAITPTHTASPMCSLPTNLAVPSACQFYSTPSGMLNETTVLCPGLDSALYIHTPSVCFSRTGVHCDHTLYFSADLSLRFNSPMFWAP